MALSVVWADDPHAAIAAVGRYAILVGTTLVGIAVIRRRDDALMVSYGFLAGAGATVAVGLLTGARFGGGRLAGAVGDPNELAAALVAALVLVPPLLVRAVKHGAHRTAALVACAGALVLTGLLLTGSRGGMLALLAVAAIAVFAGRHWRPWAVPVLVAGALAAVAIGTGGTLPGPMSHLTSTDTAGRTSLWTVAVRMVEANPLTGVGAGNFQTAAPRYVAQPGSIARTDIVLDVPRDAHNTYLQVVSEAGLPGLLALVAIEVLTIAGAVSAAGRFRDRGDRDMAFLAQAVALALVGAIAASMFISTEFDKQLWLLVAMCAGLWRVSTPVPEADPVRSALGAFSAGRLTEVPT